MRLGTPKTPGPAGMEPAWRADFLSADECAGQGISLFPAATPPSVNQGLVLNGTTQVAAGAPTNGVYVNVWTAWKAALQYIQQGLIGAATTGAYDGAKGTVGALRVAPTTLGGEFALKYLEIRNVA